MPSARSGFAPLVVIAVIVGAAGAAFAYTAGWLSPARLTPDKLVDALASAKGPSLGHRRNHAKGVCFTGMFEANGAGSELSKARVFVQGSYPALGRFNLATPDADAADATVRVRGLGLRISTPDGQEWRTAMIDAPVFLMPTPQSFYEFLHASQSKDPNAVPTVVAAHPEIKPFLAWATTAPWTSSYAQDRFNSLNSFLFVDKSGAAHAVRWSLVPTVPPEAITPADLAKRGPDYLEQDIAGRVRAAPQRWTLAVTVANPGDPTADPTKAWPADRRSVEVGTLVVQQVEAEPDGPCRDINFDPTVLPTGIRTSDDPFPAARSSAYAKSYDRRTAEAAAYPRTSAGAEP